MVKYEGQSKVSLAGPYVLGGAAAAGVVLFEVMNAVRRYSTGNAITGQIANVLNRLAGVETAAAVSHAVGIERQRYADVHYVHQPHVAVQGGSIPYRPGKCGHGYHDGHCGHDGYFGNDGHYGHEFGGYLN